MTEHDRLDELLTRTLRGQLATLPDDGFSASVVRRVRHRKFSRLLALLLASVTGLLIALAPAGQLLERLGQELANMPDKLQALPPTEGVGTLLDAFQVGALLRALGDQIMSVFALSGDSAWLLENQTVVIAALLGLGATAALRLFVR